jgi:predicted acylesterase/phospholipase RssA
MASNAAVEVPGEGQADGQTRPLRVLALDGGGIRGVIPATILAELERRTGRRIAEMFDLIAGTSTGGILALGLTVPDPAEPAKPRYTAGELVSLYAEKGKDIFARSLGYELVTLFGLFGSKYAVRGLERTLHSYFEDARLKDAVTEVLITSYDLESRDSWFIARHKARDDAAYDFPMREVARATSAAPTYFRPQRLSLTPPTAMIDGGVFANNPAMCGYVETIKLHGPQDILLVSLGTGEVKTPIHYTQARLWGLLGWVRPLIGIFMDGVAATVEHQLGWLLTPHNHQPRYFRFQVDLPPGMGSMDDTSPAHIAALKEQAQKILDTNTGPLDDLCQLLTDSRPLPPDSTAVTAVGPTT